MVESTHPLPMQYFKHGWWWSHYICKTCKRTSLKNKYISVLHAIVFIQITSIYDWVPRRFNEPINSLSWFSLTSMAILSATSRKTMNLDVLCFGSVVPEVQLLYIYILSLSDARNLRYFQYLECITPGTSEAYSTISFANHKNSPRNFLPRALRPNIERCLCSETHPSLPTKCPPGNRRITRLWSGAPIRSVKNNGQTLSRMMSVNQQIQKTTCLLIQDSTSTFVLNH